MAGDNLKRVLVAVLGHSFYGREALQGVFQHARMQAKWEMYYEGVAAHDRIGVALAQWKAQGVLAQVGDRRTWSMLVAAKVPTVNISGCFCDGLVNVCPDNLAVGRTGAEHLAGLGLREFAFCGVPAEEYSFSRERGFVETVAASGHHSHTFHMHVAWYGDHRQLVAWLRALPKPVGLMACNDYVARCVMWACRRGGIQVPDEVALLGVDNDDVEGALCLVPLSSVNLPMRLIGQKAAGLLDDLMRGRKPPAAPVLVPPLGVVVRQSTDVYATTDTLLVGVLRHIRGHADQALTVDDLLQRFTVSRRSLEIRFQKAFGYTLGGEIVRTRLERAKMLLTMTDRKVTSVHAGCGFSRYSYFSRLFRRKTGMTPVQYRRQFRAGTPAGTDVPKSVPAHVAAGGGFDRKKR